MRHPDDYTDADAHIDQMLADYHQAQVEAYADKHNLRGGIEVLPCPACDAGRLVPDKQTGEMVLCEPCRGEGYICESVA